MSLLLPIGRRRLLLGAMAASVGMPSTSRAQTELVKITYQLDWRFEAGVLPYVVALRKGYFRQEGLDVTLNVGSGASATVTRIASGAADMGTGDVNSLAEFAANNNLVPAKAVMMMYEQTPASVISLKKTGIRQPSDLRGRQLAAPANDGARKIFPLFAAMNGLDAAKDVSWLTVDASMRETMLARGQVDVIAGYIASGMLTLQKLGVSADDIDVMRFSDNGVNLYGNAVMASTAFLDKQPAAVAGLLRAVTRALRDIVASPSEAVALLKQQDALVDVRTETARLDLILNREIGVPVVRERGIGAIDVQRFQRGIDALAPALGFKSVPQARQLVDTSLLPSAESRRVFSG